MNYIVLLNWNGWQDTIACLHSLVSLTTEDVRVIVCDNDSSDGSQQHIVDWATGLVQPKLPDNPILARLLNKSTHVSYQQLHRSEVLNNKAPVALPWLTIIQNGGNLGFAGGNNVGLTYALAQNDMNHVWLLNNDTLVEPNCLDAMLERMRDENGMCGSRVMFYDDPTVVQALGGNSYNRWSGNATASVGRFTAASATRNTKAVESQLDYISGCSMLVSRQFLESVGLMDDRYFLYYEEIDWAVRAGKQVKKIYADDAVVYHKEGSSIGSASLDRRASLLSEFYCFRNKLWFTATHYPRALPSCYAFTWLQALNRFRRGYWQSGWQIVQILLGKRAI